jgi:cysteine synthase
LLNRIKTVKEFVRNNPNSYNPNQYENPWNYLSYFHTLGVEICDSFERLDNLFISVSSGGTIIGLSRRLKEKFPDLTIVAVDVEGSMIFRDKHMARKISGIGASMRSPLFDKAIIDRVVILSQSQIIEGAYELLKEQAFFVGPSAAAAYVGAKLCLTNVAGKDEVSLFISPDHGSSYLDTIYNSDWVRENIATNIEVHEVFE